MSDNPTEISDAAPAPLAPPPVAGGGMSLAALIVGIAAAVSAVIPGLSFGTWAPAGVAIVLGILTLVKHKPTRGRGLAGVILGGGAWLVAIIVSIVFIVGLTAVATPHAASPDRVPAPAASPSDAGSPTASATPDTPVVPADSVYSGSGDTVIQITKPDGADGPAAASITGGGSENFVVWSLDSNATQQGLLVNTIGNYSGTVLMDARDGEVTTALQITADGPWTVTVHSLGALRSFTGNAVTGSGDDVVLYDGKAGAAAITNTGSANFVMWTYGSRTDLVVNEIGNYSGTDLWQAGPSIVAITSDGTWGITVQ